MDALFRLNGALPRHPDVDAWFARPDPLRALVEPWFEALRGCGDDVRELIHDGQPTSCVGDAAFAYVDAFSAHANVGFFYGAALDDPASLLRGSGKRMRHVRLHPEHLPDSGALADLIAAAYRDVGERLHTAGQ